MLGQYKDQSFYHFAYHDGVLGELDDYATISSNYIISPFVALIPQPNQFKIDSKEVGEIIEVPISALLDKDCLREESRLRDDKEVTSYFYHYQGTVIWGATAWILNQFLDIFARVMKDN